MQQHIWMHREDSIPSVSIVFALLCICTMAAAGAPTTMKAAIAVDGELKVVDRPVPDVKAGQVLIRVMATAVNRADTLQRKGKYAPPPGTTDVLGLEAAGVVERVGERLPEDDEAGVRVWKTGERAMALLSGGGYAEYVVAEQSLLLPVPARLGWAQAAAVPEVWLTAYQLLRFVAQVPRKGAAAPAVPPPLAPPAEAPSVLVHAAGSGVGTAALQLVKSLLGGSAVAVAGSKRKLDFAGELGAVAGINYKGQPSFGEAVRAATGGKGADVILDCVGGSHAEQNGIALALEGTWVIYGLMGGAVPMTAKKAGNTSEAAAGGGAAGAKEGPAPAPMLAAVLRKRARVLGTTLRARSRGYKAALVRAFWEEAGAGLEGGDLKPVVDRVFGAGGVEGAGEGAGGSKGAAEGGGAEVPGLGHLAAAHRYVESNANLGKVVVLVAADGV